MINEIIGTFGVTHCPITLASQLRAHIPLAQSLLQKRSYTSLPKKSSEEHSLQMKGARRSSNASSKDKIMSLWNRYGVVFVGTYLGVYCVTLGSIFVILDFGLLGPERAHQMIADVAGYLNLSDHFDPDHIDPESWNAWYYTWIARMNPNFAFAWIVTKFTEPLRLATSVLITPPLARLVKRE